MGQELSYEVRKTVNPLVLTVNVHWTESISPNIYRGVWNLYQMWASKNECVTDGKAFHGPYSMTVTTIVKRRLGYPKDEHPLG